MEDTEDIAAALLTDDGLGHVVVETMMERGTTHDKDRTKAYAAIRKDELDAGLHDLRRTLEDDMIARRAFDPDAVIEEGADAIEDAVNRSGEHRGPGATEGDG